ncbi:MAG TPA: hypothetical protein VK576_08720, partial [Thermoleophilia bacterium]|nr:hypothetical protein [Thermoleophilia bacterium]
VAISPTLGGSLAAVFGNAPAAANSGVAGAGGATAGAGTGGAGTGGATSGGKLSAQARALIAKANGQFDAAQAALQAGDFAGYGRQIKALRSTLAQLKSLQ